MRKSQKECERVNVDEKGENGTWFRNVVECNSIDGIKGEIRGIQQMNQLIFVGNTIALTHLSRLWYTKSQVTIAYYSSGNTFFASLLLTMAVVPDVGTRGMLKSS